MVELYAKLCGWLSQLQSPFLLLIRLYWGYGFFMAGKGKLFNLERTAGFFADLSIPFPMANAAAAGATECVGGLLLLIGLGSRLVSLPLAFTMIVAYATAHREALWIMEEIIQQEAYTYLMAALLIMVFGPGKFSIDYLLKKKFCKECAE